MIDTKQLYKTALKAREKSYCPYSSFAVGAALLCESGRVYTGCNIENSAFSPSICAERTAFAKAVSEGERSFKAIAIAGGNASDTPGKQCMPCGVCRQVMCEFCDPDDFVIIVGTQESERTLSLRELMPEAFEQ